MLANWSVDSDTLRQWAAQCRWKSCTVRPLAATCRSPSRLDLMKRDRADEAEKLLRDTEASLRTMLMSELPKVIETGAALFVNSEFVPHGFPKTQVFGKGQAFYRVARDCLGLREILSLPTTGTVGALFLEACAENASESDNRLGPKRLAAALLERLAHEA